jgi:hypothetical protein
MENVGIFYDHSVYITVILVSLFYLVYFSSFWYIMSRKIWQPWVGSIEESPGIQNQP